MAREWREATLPPVPACPHCKRRPADGHSDICPEYQGLVRIKGPSLAEWAEQERQRRRSGIASTTPRGRTTPSAAPGAPKSNGQSGPVSTLIIDPDALEAIVVNPEAGACFDCGAEVQGDRLRCVPCTRANGNPKRATKETPMVSSIAEALESAGITTLHPVAAESALKCCKKCGRSDVEFGRGGADSYCKACRVEVLQAGRKKAMAAPEPATPSAEETGISIDDLMRGDVDEEQDLVVEHQVVDDAGGTDWVEDPTPVLEHPAPSPSSAPNAPAGPRALAELRAEQARVEAYLAELKAEIEQAEALEELSRYTPDQLAIMLEEARRQARMIELALGGRAA